MRPHWKALLVTLILLTGFIGIPVWAQTGGSEFFPETGHWVSNEFLDKYYSVPNGHALFGEPITEAFIDERTGILVQYFENARFEFHPDAVPDLQVQLSNLGDFLYIPGEALTIPPNFPSCRNFQETGYQVCYAFLDFFEANGGVTQFGYPISNFEIHDGWISQYFQRARFEWHPELPAGEQVALAQLGVRFFQFNNEDPALLQPNENADIIREVDSLQAYAFVSKPVIPLGQNEQTLYVIVYDQAFNPVENGIVSYVITFPDGKIIEGNMPGTNTRGLSIKEIMIDEQSTGTVEISVIVTFRILQKHTLTSFQLW
jgi:hypothetical protein